MEPPVPGTMRIQPPTQQRSDRLRWQLTLNSASELPSCQVDAPLAAAVLCTRSIGVSKCLNYNDVICWALRRFAAGPAQGSGLRRGT